jgi:hypothetical protein
MVGHMSDETPSRPARRRRVLKTTPAPEPVPVVLAEPVPEEDPVPAGPPAGLLRAHSGRPGPGLALGVALALVLVQGLHVLTSMFQGLSLPSHDQSGVRLDLWQRLGSGFARFDQTEGLLLLLVVALVALACLADIQRGASQPRPIAEAILGLAGIVAAVICIGTLLGLRSDLHLINAKVTSVQRWVLVTYVVGSFGPAAIALVASIVARRLLPGPRHRLRLTVQ